MVAITPSIVKVCLLLIAAFLIIGCFVDATHSFARKLSAASETGHVLGSASHRIPSSNLSGSISNTRNVLDNVSDSILSSSSDGSINVSAIGVSTVCIRNLEGTMRVRLFCACTGCRGIQSYLTAVGQKNCIPGRWIRGITNYFPCAWTVEGWGYFREYEGTFWYTSWSNYQGIVSCRNQNCWNDGITKR